MRIEVISEKPVKATEAFEVIKTKFTSLIGSLSAAKANLRAIPERSGNELIIRVHRKFVDAVRAALSLSTEVDGQKIVFRAIKVSGSIAKV
ncbi:MAG: Rpp14/Pop5 family protein [Nanoarchaeota archaeon]